VEELLILLNFSLILIAAQRHQYWNKEEIPQEGFTCLGCLVYHLGFL